jgi:hypothetical protein
MTDRTPRTPRATLHPNALTPAARQALDDAWDAWDEAAHLAEVRDYTSDTHNEAEADAWARYAALKADIEAGMWPKRMVAVGDASGVTAHTYTTCEWQHGDDWHAERQELADYDASVRAASIYQ